MCTTGVDFATISSEALIDYDIFMESTKAVLESIT